MLAWNGGGKSNFTEIVHDGGYEMKVTPSLHESVSELKNELKSELKDIVAELESLIEKA